MSNSLRIFHIHIPKRAVHNEMSLSSIGPDTTMLQIGHMRIPVSKPWLLMIYKAKSPDRALLIIHERRTRLNVL